MDGFYHVELGQPGIFGRLLGRKPKENAIREISNLLAERPSRDLSAADIENILLSLIQFGGHLPKGGYDGQNGITQSGETRAATVHG